MMMYLNTYQITLSMNNNRYKIINNILLDKPTRLRESYFIKHHKNIHNQIIDYINVDIPFKQKMWHWVNELPTIYRCKCGKPTTFNKNWKDGYRKACSPKCAQSNQETKDKRKKTTIKKYGVDNISKLESIKEKQEKTNLERYGTKSTFQNEEVKQKWKDNIKEKYGVEHIFQLESVKDKIKKTFLDEYGVDHQSKIPEVQDKIKKTTEERYGVEHISQSSLYKKQFKETSLKNWGVVHPSKSKKFKEKRVQDNLKLYGKTHYYKTDEFKEKAKETLLERYGVDHYSRSSEYKEYLKSDRYKNTILKNRRTFYHNKGFKFIGNSKRNGFVTLQKINGTCNHLFDTHPSTLEKRLQANIDCCTKCYSLNSSKSYQEVNILEFIESLNVEVVRGDKSIINPLELYFYLPQHNIAFEYNGLYWHSELNKDKYYHIDKMNKASEKNVELINIWEDDWLYKQDIVKSIIKNKLGIIENKIWGRKCVIKEVKDRKLVNTFLENNHLQGKTNYTHSIGLYNNDKLVSLMLFLHKKDKTELVRFCNIINYIVVGSASKLFKHYIKNYHVNNIQSFSDTSVFDGDVYNNLRFKHITNTPINYWWNVGGIRRHRFSFNKQKLIKMGGDPNKSEVDIMHSMGNYRVWGCGLKKWLWVRN